MTMQARVLVGSALFLLAASVAAAQPASVPAAQSPPPPALVPVAPAFILPAEERTEDYRYQLVLGDLAGIALVGVVPSNATAALAATSYFVTPLTIHAAHDEGTRVVASLALRAGLPLLGGLLGRHVELDNACADDDWDCGGGGGGELLGVLVGAAAAIIIDDGFLGRSHRIEKPAPAWAPRISIAPDRERALGSVSLGVAGQF